MFDVYGIPVFMNAAWSVLRGNDSGLLFGYKGLRHDPESGLVYNRSRYHHPLVGRFMQREGVDYLDSNNLYEYVRSRPTFFVDPTGYASSASGSAVNIAVGVVVVVAAILAVSKSIGESEKSNLPGCPTCDKSTPEKRIFLDIKGKCCVRVELVCRDVGGAVGQHCYLSIKHNVDNQELGTISAFPEHEDAGMFRRGKIAFKPDQDLGSGGEVRSFSTGGTDDCKWLICAYEYAKSLDKSYEYNAVASNSNTFVWKIITHCGGTASFPWTAPGATDIEPPSRQYPGGMIPTGY